MEGDVVVVVVVVAVEVEARADEPPPRDGGGAGAGGLALESWVVAAAVHGDDEHGYGPPVRLPPSIPLPRFPSPLPPRHRQHGRRLCRGLLFPLHRSPELRPASTPTRTPPESTPAQLQGRTTPPTPPIQNPRSRSLVDRRWHCLG